MNEANVSATIMISSLHVRIIFTLCIAGVRTPAAIGSRTLASGGFHKGSFCVPSPFSPLSPQFGQRQTVKTNSGAHAYFLSLSKDRHVSLGIAESRWST